MTYNYSNHFYRLQEEGYINKNWILNTHDFSIWNMETNNKIKLNQWINWNFNKDIN